MEGHSPATRGHPAPWRWAFALLVAALAGCSNAYRSSPPVGGPPQANVITAEEIAAFPSTVSVEEILQQHAPGIWLRRRNEPGGAMTVDVRAMGAPLFVIDGVPSEQHGTTLGLNPRDIETIEIVKQGGRLAMYGLRGANGVVLIQTKGSSPSRPQ